MTSNWSWCVLCISASHDELIRVPDGEPLADDEAGASKLWAVYVDEAERYDTALVESWKSDMQGMLIFVSELLV